MSEETIGTARIDIVVNAEQFKTEIARVKTLQSQMGESGEAAYQKLNKGAKAATTSLLKWAEGLGKTTEEQRLLNAAMRGVPIEALESVRKKVLAQRDAMEASKRAAQEQAEAVKAYARLQAEAFAESERRLQQEAAARQKMVAQNTAAFRAEQANQQRLAQMRADALHAFGPELAARERENAEIQRSNAVRERLNAFLATERGQRIQEAEAIRRQGTAYAAQSRAFGSTAKSARELQFAMRTLPAQISDITVSLASGQRPLMVLLQQGSQLKDMFGGIKPAAAAFGRTLLGLVNPFTVTAAAAAALLVAWKEGSDEAVAYNKALITTGNYAGVTAAQLQAMAGNIAAVTGTQHAAAAALAEVAGSGRFTAEQIGLVGRAAVAMSELTGQATSETIKQFKDLGEKPVETILKLNETQHFLTAAIYEQIKALEDQGHAQEAAQLAMQTYSDTVETRRAAVVENLGLIEQSWRGIKNATLEAVDAALSLGRTRSDQQKFDVLVENRNAAKDLIDRGMGADAYLGTTAQKYYDDSTQKLLAMADDRAAKEKEQAKKAAADKLVQDQADSDREAAQYFTNAQKRAAAYLKAENEFNERIARAMKAGNTGLADKERQQKASVLAGINAKFADKKADNFWSTSITGDPRADLNAKLADEIADFKKEADQWARSTTAAAAYKQTLTDMLDTRQRAIDLQVASIGMGQREIEQQQALIGIDEDYNRKKADLQKRQQNSTSALERDGYQQQLDDLAKYHDKRIQMEVDGWRREEEARKSAALGASAAIKDFEDAAGNVAGQTYDLFSNAFDGMTDALTNFVTTGKLDFKSFTKEILADLAKMEIRILASRILTSILGGGSDGQGGQMATVGDGQWSGYANGGVFANSPGLSAYSGGVYNTPHMFKFASGAGVFGEAGPEAIMPLRRGPDGKLGVAAAGGGGSIGDVNVTLNLTQNDDGSVSGDADVKAMGQLAKQLGERMKGTAQQVLMDAMRPGGLLYKSRSGMPA